MSNKLIHVRYFAMLREQLGVEQESITKNDIHTIADLVKHLYARGGLWPHLLGAPNVQIAHNHVQVHDHEQILACGDEVAFLPPVTGG